MPDSKRGPVRVLAIIGLLGASCPALADDAETPANGMAAHGRSDVRDTAQALPTIPVGADEPLEVPAPHAPVRLEEIVVTATKRKTLLRELPASIEYFDGGELEARGRLHLPDFLETRPGVTQAPLSPGITRISIRGISTDAFPLSPLPTATGIFIGDTVFSDTYLASIQPDLSAFDLASVELLKGPQGTLFGGSALAGAIRYVLREPELGRWQTRGFAQFIDAEDGGQSWTAGAVLNLPLADRAALRLGYVRRGHPGVYDIDRNPRLDDIDTGRGEQQRGMLRWQPRPELEIKLTHLSQDYATPNTSATADTRESRQNDKRVMAQPTDHRFGLDSLELSYDFPALRLVSVSSANGKDWHIFGDATAAVIGRPPEGYDPALGAFQAFDQRSRTRAQELRLQSTGCGATQWLVGAFVYESRLFAEFLQDTIAHRELLGGGSTNAEIQAYRETSLLYARTRVTASEQALFVDLGRSVGKRLSLSTGARLYRTRVQGGIYRTGLLPRAQNNGQDVNFEDNDLTERGVNPRIAATWRFSAGLSTYLQASRGYRFGGLQSAPSTQQNNVPPAYRSDSLWNYELGLRSSWLDRALSLDVTAYYIDYLDPQIGLRTTDPGVAISYVDNVGGAVSRGLEGRLRWQTPLRGVALDVAGGVTDAHTTQAFTAPGNVQVPAGAQLPGSARSQYALDIRYATPRLGRYAIDALASYHYIGKGFADITQVHAINDYGTLDLQLSLSAGAWRGAPTLAFKLANALDTSAAKFGATTNPVTGDPFDYFFLNPPRTFSMRLGFEF